MSESGRRVFEISPHPSDSNFDSCIMAADTEEEIEIAEKMFVELAGDMFDAVQDGSKRTITVEYRVATADDIAIVDEVDP